METYRTCKLPHPYPDKQTKHLYLCNELNLDLLVETRKSRPLAASSHLHVGPEYGLLLAQKRHGPETLPFRCLD